MKHLPGVLMVAYYFPPMGGDGVQRTLKFVKYLPEFGWQAHVLTVRNTTSLQDPHLEAEIPLGQQITRTAMLRLPGRLPWRLRSFFSRWFLVVDEQIGWLPFATAAGLKIISGGDIQAIYSTSTPYTTHLVARSLHRRTRLPWVADFRDPWMGNPFLKFPTAFHRRLNESLEQSVFTEADKVILNTEASRRHYIQKYSNLPVAKFITIPNGYDRADIPEFNRATESNTAFTIVHLGSLYRKTRSSEYFLRGLNEAIQSGEVNPDRIRVQLIGNIDKETHGFVNRFGLNDSVEILGYLPHHQALSYIFTADLLLLFPYYGAGGELSIPAKVYEYLVSQKTILCLAEPGACADLVLKCRAGMVVTPTDPVKIARQLSGLYRKWLAGELRIDPDLEVIVSYERRKLTGQLAQLLDGVSA